MVEQDIVIQQNVELGEFSVHLQGEFGHDVKQAIGGISVTEHLVTSCLAVLQPRYEADGHLPAACAIPHLRPNLYPARRFRLGGPLPMKVCEISVQDVLAGKIWK